EAAARLAVLAGVRLLEHVAVERVETGVGALGDVAPHRPHLFEGRDAGRGAGAEALVHLRVGHLALAVVQEVLLLLPRHVPDAPAEAVQRQDPLDGLLGLDGAERAGELVPGEPALLDQRARHAAGLPAGPPPRARDRQPGTPPRAPA